MLTFVPVSALDEDPLFTGPKTRCHVDSGGLMLDEETFGAIPSVAAAPSWASPGGVASTGLYQFATSLVFDAVTRSRLTSHIKLEAINEHDYWDSKIGNIDTWPDIDGTLAASVDASVYGALTDDEPAGDPTWSAFTRIDSAEISARAVGLIECRMSSADRAFNLWLTELRLYAEELA